MKYEEYENIVRTINKFEGMLKDLPKMLIAKYNSINPNTLYSILQQEIELKMKINHRSVFGQNVDYYKIYLKEIEKKEAVGIILRLAHQLDTCPALLARRVLEGYYDTDQNNRNKVSKLMKDTHLIQDGRLSYEIYLAVLYDNHYGPISNAISQSIGEEYELILKSHLKERDIAFCDENQLRLKGYDKTPDCKLEIPIAVNGTVVNWIESKARFGSQDVHDKNIKHQYLSYWNRFGPGLVIYWFGFLDNIIQSSETRFIVMDHFPENITYMDPSILASK